MRVSLRQEYRDLYDEMQTAVAVVLRCSYVILALDQRDVILPQQTVCEQIYILGKRAYYPHTRNVRYASLDGFEAERQSPVAQLADDAVGRLYTALDGFDGIAVVLEREFFV